MDDFAPDRIQGRLLPLAFIYYQPKTGMTKEQVYHNPEARRILSASAPVSKKGTASSLNLSSLCVRWKELLDERLDKAGGSGEEAEPGFGFIDLYQSHRRRYGVRGILLSGQSPDSRKQNKEAGQYIFVLERLVTAGMDLSPMFRQWNLNRREQVIVRLLLQDKSNKEMADILDLSLDTVKGYLKLLRRRLDVSSRCGIIARLLTGRNSSS